jgi:hypothetical protein
LHARGRKWQGAEEKERKRNFFISSPHQTLPDDVKENQPGRAYSTRGRVTVINTAFAFLVSKTLKYGDAGTPNKLDKKPTGLKET